MDIISELPDELLLKILSFLPTEVAVSASLLSKRYECLWMWLPKLDYVMSTEKLQCFLNKTLQLHRAKVIESFRIRLELGHRLRQPEDIKQCVEVAVSRHLRELDIYYKPYSYNENILLNCTSSLYSCKSLVVLKLGGVIRLEVPRMGSLPSLETLQLRNVNELDGESLGLLLSICPILENLSVDCFCSCISGNISIKVPSLQSLSLCIRYDPDGLRIDTPSLKYFKLDDYNEDSSYISIENMPKLEEAYVDVGYRNIESVIGSITSVKRLTLCCFQAVYSDKFVFDKLKHLKLCDCGACSAKLLARLLKDSPSLQVLDIFHMESHFTSNMVYWNEPSTVPECLLLSLQTFNWSGCSRRPQNRSVAAYILKNARLLNTATISFG